MKARRAAFRRLIALVLALFLLLSLSARAEWTIHAEPDTVETTELPDGNVTEAGEAADESVVETGEGTPEGTAEIANGDPSDIGEENADPASTPSDPDDPVTEDTPVVTDETENENEIDPADPAGTETGADEVIRPVLTEEDGALDDTKEEQKEETQEEEPAKTFEEFKEFDDIIVTVKAEEGVFPDDATLFVEEIISEKTQEEVEADEEAELEEKLEAVEEERQEEEASSVSETTEEAPAEEPAPESEPAAVESEEAEPEVVQSETVEDETVGSATTDPAENEEPVAEDPEDASADEEVEELTVAKLVGEEDFTPDDILDHVEAAISEVREEKTNVALSRTFNIKVLDADGNEIQPADQNKVEISFRSKTVNDKNLDTTVYHIADNTEYVEYFKEKLEKNEEIDPEDEKRPAPYLAEALKGEADQEDFTVETGGFSWYTVEFTYGDLQYVLDGDETIPLAVILSAVGLEGVPTEAEVSDDTLFSVSDATGEWLVTAHEAFTSVEWMKVTIDGIVYLIVVTDTPTFVLDYDKLAAPPTTVYGGGYGTETFNSNVFQPQKTASGSPSNRYDKNNPSPIRLRATNNSYWSNLVSNKYYNYGAGAQRSTIVVYPEAAILPNGTKKDVVVTYSNISLYLPTTGTQATTGDELRPYLTDLSKNGVSFDTGAVYSRNYPYGIEADINIKITEPGTNTPVNTGTFMLTVSGIDTVREGTPYSNLYGASGKNNYSESVTVTSGSVGQTYPNGTNEKDFMVEASASGITLHAISSGKASSGGSVDQTIGFLTRPASRSISTKTGPHGSYAVYDVTGDNTKLYPETGDYGTETKLLTVENNHAVKVVMVPESGYKIEKLIIDEVESEAYTETETTGGGLIYEYTFPADIYSHSLEVSWRWPENDFTASTGKKGSIVLWSDGKFYKSESDVPSGVTKLMDHVREEGGAQTFTFAEGIPITYKLIPDAGCVLQMLTVNGTPVNPKAHDVSGNEVEPDSTSIAYYTYTFDKTTHSNQTLAVSWQYDIPECDDCKNLEACENCYLAKSGANLNGYELVANGVYRGGDANSVDSYTRDTAANNTFANPMPYGTVFIDTSKLEWSTANKDNFEIDIKDSRFKFVGSGSGARAAAGTEDKSIEGKPFDAELLRWEGGVLATDPSIAYYGLIHSYLNYGTETNENLGVYQRENEAPGTIANGTYTSGSNSVTIVNGTNIITPTNGDYLYQVTYKDAAILPDGSRGNLIIRTKKVEIESSITSAEPVYVALQKANQMTVVASFLKDFTSLRKENQQLPQNDVYGTDNRGDPNEVRNAVGSKNTYEIIVQNKDGTPVNGIILYGAMGLNQPSYESVWGREPKDTYLGNGGSDTSIEPDSVQDKWKDTHEFYEFAEGIKIVDGARSYMLVPEYKASPGGTTRILGIDTLLNGQKYRTDDPLNVEPYNMPSQVQGSGTNSLANGVRVVSTASRSLRDDNGTFVNGKRGNGWDYTTSNITYLPDEKRWSTNPGNDNSYDTGFAVLLDSNGTTMQWTGNYNLNGNINTTLFDSSFAQYLLQSHGTGGGIYVEDYDLSKGCEVIYREGLVTLSLGASVRSTIVPEDGYRVSRFTIDDVEFRIIYDNAGNPQRLVYNGNSRTLKIGDTVNLNLSTNPLEGGTSSFDLAVTYNSDGIVDVLFSNRRYAGGANMNNIHADFETDYYFMKVWDGGVANPESIPDDLVFWAAPYVAVHDYVDIDGTRYQISKVDDGAGNIVTRYTDVTDPTRYFDLNEDQDDPDLKMIYSEKYPSAKYPQLTIDGTIYVVMGNDLYRTVLDPVTQQRVVAYTVDPGTGKRTEIEPSRITVKLERYEDDAYIKATQFRVTKSAAGDTTNSYVQRETIDGDIIWKIRYPDAGVSSMGWDELPLETTDIDDASHDLKKTHVERIYWLATEDINSLKDKTWILDEYINEYENDAAEVPGRANYIRADGSLIYEDKAFWYTLATKDHDDVDSLKGQFAEANMALMTPLASGVFKPYGKVEFLDGKKYVIEETTAGTSYTRYARGRRVIEEAWVDPAGAVCSIDGARRRIYPTVILNGKLFAIVNNTTLYQIAWYGEENMYINEGEKYAIAQAYEGWGGQVINHLVETKLRVFKHWIGDAQNQALRENLKMTIKREHVYRQPDTVPSDHLGITVPKGSAWNTVMKTIPGTGVVEVFKRELEPVLTAKLSAKTIDAEGAGTYGADDYVKYVDDTTGAELYIWYNVTDKAICYWTDADAKFIYLNPDSSDMFKDLAALRDIPGVDGFNSSRVENMNNMFGITSGTGSIANLDYLRKWDTRNVKTMVGFMRNQPNLTPSKIKGIVDWNVESVTRPTRENPTAENGFAYMFENPNQNIVGEYPFIYYPLFVIDGDGNIDTTYDDTAGDDSMDLVYYENGLNKSGQPRPNNGTLEKSGDNLEEWVWTVDELLPSDSIKWNYKFYEDAMTEYFSLDGAVTFENRVPLARNEESGYLEYSIRNKLSLHDVTISKNVTGSMGSRDKYFKFVVEIIGADEGTTFDLNVTNMETAPTDNAATEKTYKVKVYRYISRYGVITTDANRDVVVAKCLEDGGDPDTDITEYTVMGAANSRDDDVDKQIVYQDTPPTKQSSYDWMSKPSDTTYRYHFVRGEWHQIDSGGRRSAVSEPTAASVTVFADVLNHETMEAAKKYIWIDTNNVARYAFDGNVWNVDASGHGEWDPIPGGGTPPSDARLLYQNVELADTKVFVWKDTDHTYEYVEPGWWKMDESGSVYIAPEEPPANAEAAYAGRADQQVTSDASGNATFEIYLQHGQSVTVEGLPHGAFYTVTEHDTTGYKTTITDGNGDYLIKGVAVSGQSGMTAEKSDSGTFYLLKNGAGYEEPADYYAEFEGDFKDLPRYSINDDGEYVVDMRKGRYYLLTNGLYGSIPPRDRYASLTDKFTLDVTKAYTNDADSVIPTEIHYGWFGWLALILPASGYGAFRLRRRRRERDAA